MQARALNRLPMMQPDVRGSMAEVLLSRSKESVTHAGPSFDS
jgi:hypothetical protein